jgi:hypothetical protein
MNSTYWCVHNKSARKKFASLIEPEGSLKFSQKPTIFIMLHSENIQESLDDIWYRGTSRKFNLGQYRFSESQIQKSTIFIPTPAQ